MTADPPLVLDIDGTLTRPEGWGSIPASSIRSGSGTRPS